MTDASSTSKLPQLPFPIRWALQGFIRHSMVGLGAALLAAHALPDQTATDQFVNWAVNGVLILGGLGWSLLNERAKTQGTPAQSPQS